MSNPIPKYIFQTINGAIRTVEADEITFGDGLIQFWKDNKQVSIVPVSNLDFVDIAPKE